MHHEHPCDDELAMANSCYLACRDGRLINALTSCKPPEAARVAHERLRAKVLDPDYPCLGARSVVSSGGYRLGWYHRLGSAEAAAGLCRDLYTFVREQPMIGTQFTSYFAMFESPHLTDEDEFDRLMWLQLQAIHDRDSQYHDWDPTVSDDPADPRFAFSVAGVGFFIIGMHVGSSRFDRRLASPTLIFNPQSMFERLRAQHKYDPMRRAVRLRTEKFGMSLNSNLGNFGEVSAAQQYSGRRIEPDWICPLIVHRRRGLREPAP